MPLKNKLNQYELDTALAVLRDKHLPLDELKSKTVAVSGGSELHKSIIYSLLCLNDEKGLGIKVISVGESVPTLYDDDFFTVAEPDELGDVDLFIEAGFLRYDGETVSRIFADCIDRIFSLLAFRYCDGNLELYRPFIIAVGIIFSYHDPSACVRNMHSYGLFSGYCAQNRVVCLDLNIRVKSAFAFRNV